ncbi:MAG TPA: hypothetical protein VK524_09625 [Polyangiaceae bacterium]|nr:hypothetical protein [Polyangiaceae bacterium]
MNARAKLVPILVPVLLAACSGAAEPDEASIETNVGVSHAALPVNPIEPPEDPEPTPRPPRPVPTTPPTPVPHAPPDSDLRPDGAMRYYGGGSVWGVQIDVVNIGTTPATGVSGRVSIGPYFFTGKLYQYFGGTSTTPNTVNPRERGYIKIDVPPTLLSLCGSYPVQIDVDHTMQAGANPFANDSRSVLAYETGASCRLTWYRPVNGATLGHEPDAKIAGKSLRDIVSSVEIARGDNNKCSACHHSASPYPYAPAVAQNMASVPPIDPFAVASGDQAWLGTSAPWLPRFLELPESGSAAAKPAYLKDAFRKWLLDGAIK